MSAILKPFEWVTGFGSDVKKNTGSLDSFSKMATNGWKVIETTAQVSNPAVTNVMNQFKGFSALVSTLNIVDRASEWFSPKKREEWTWQKYVSQSALTVSHGLEFTSFLHQAGIVNLGSFASQIAPGIVPLEVAKNTFYIPASLFGIWHSAKAMGKQDAKVSSLEGKLQKWTDRMQSAAADKDRFVNDVVKPKLQAIADKLAELDAKKNSPSGKLDDEEKKVYSKLEVRQRRWTVYQEQLDDEKASDLLNADCQKKIDGYNRNLGIEKQNSGKVKTKEWLSIANNVGKFVLGILGLVAIFVGFAASVAFVASFAAGWFATHTLNLAKNLYDDRNKVQSYVKPHLDPVPT